MAAAAESIYLITPLRYNDQGATSRENAFTLISYWKERGKTRAKQRLKKFLVFSDTKIKRILLINFMQNELNFIKMLKVVPLLCNCAVILLFRLC